MTKIPLQGSSHLKDRNRVIFCENDKAYAFNCIAMSNETDLCAVSIDDWSKFHDLEWESLTGKTVYIWPKNKINYSYLKNVQKKLKSIDPEAEVLWVNPKNLGIPKEGDIEDFIKKYSGNDKEVLRQVQAVLETANTTDLYGRVKKRYEETIAGTRETIPLPWDEIDRATMAIAPASLTVLCGEGGAGKSYFLTQMCEYWHMQLGHKVALFELEEDKEFHIIRMIAQKSGEQRLVNDRWVKDNPEEARAIFEDYAYLAKEMENVLYDAPRKQVSLDYLAKWVEDRCKEETRIICIDPITAAEPSVKPWIADTKFINDVHQPLRDHGASLVVVTHPKKGGVKDVGLDGVAGGAAWGRFCQTALWLRNHYGTEDIEILERGWKVMKKANRSLVVLKARSGIGGGRSFAIDMNDLVFNEIGEEVKQTKKGR